MGGALIARPLLTATLIAAALFNATYISAGSKFTLIPRFLISDLLIPEPSTVQESGANFPPLSKLPDGRLETC